LASRPAVVLSDELPTVPLASAPAPVGEIGAAVMRALAKRFGVDASSVPVAVLDAARYAAEYHRLLGDGKRPLGFAYEGVVYIRDNVFHLSHNLLAHEVLHVLSSRFTEEALERGFSRLVEGITDYLTYQVYPRRKLRASGTPRSDYAQDARLAAQLAQLIGEDVLRSCYFKAGFDELVKRTDRILGKGALVRAAQQVEDRDYQAAQRTLRAGGQ
jgi:hypothetical protein